MPLNLPMDKYKMHTIYPVILPVPEKSRGLTGREKVSALSRHARCALEISGEKSGAVLHNPPKDPNGVPLPVDGNYWSLTHKSEYVGGVVAGSRIGIDIEKIRDCSKSLFRKTAHDFEWDLSDMDPFELFFRYWTSKEAVLKASGTGVKDLLKCRIVEIVSDNYLVINYRNEIWPVEHFFFNGHIASINKDAFHIEWTLL
jgi:4'-phosphopantetheinyl transferase